MKKDTKAFTLVELIVVITIIAILWTIAFISLQWYSKSSRDSVRINDVSNMKVSLEIFHLNAGKYPLPDDKEEVTYSWWTLWYQWFFWENVISQLSRNLNEIPTDSLTDKQYIYSVANNKNEFEILSLLESDFVLNWINQSNAANIVVTPRVDWTFNWIFVKTADYIIPVPSIITSEDIWTWLELTNLNIKSQIISWGTNIPNYGNVNYNTGALNWLILSVAPVITSESTNPEKLEVINAIQAAYTGSILSSNYAINNILLKTTESEKLSVVETVVLGNSSTIVDVIYTCATQPSYTHTSFTTWTPTVNNTVWQNTNNANPCYYECTDWYTWNDCATAPWPDLYTTLLIHSNTSNWSTTFVDSSSSNLSFVAGWDVQHSTLQSKFWASSIKFDGTGDYLQIPNNDAFNFGSDDFTVDLWFRGSTVNGTWFMARWAWTSRWGFYYTPSTSLSFYTNWSGWEPIETGITDNEWYHLAWVHDGSTSISSFYINWVLWSTHTDVINTTWDPFVLGWYSTTGVYNGYMDEIRISKGIKRTEDPSDPLYLNWWASFTPPTSAY